MPTLATLSPSVAPTASEDTDTTGTGCGVVQALTLGGLVYTFVMRRLVWVTRSYLNIGVQSSGISPGRQDFYYPFPSDPARLNNARCADKHAVNLDSVPEKTVCRG
ncbi:hypothetical protein B0I72DRAFT_128813 [Yarrowia lipolytica]|nr:hypothetical protein B0I72DRAFT_128813 [Yarrowia lipolytica]RDW40297.1 hypothetical protein B0I73DRAFT_140181 [Yarrowia lipolytica]RDW44832.1 hypothetical protein B0I74DRAFT_129762 [Yarrowia lipolytica]RDW51660.1 hypothetical protein B0I75DRAFT_129528 [Yarrowia lipolytica]